MGVINLGILIKKIMGKIAGAGYVKNTDYASSSKGGTIKVDSTYATDITSGGKLKAKEITAEAYSEANEAAFISKATLDNVLAAQPAGGFTADVLYDGNLTSANASTPIILAHPVTDYKFILFNQHDSGNAIGSSVFYVPLLTFNATVGNNTPYPTTFKAFRFPDENDKTKMTFPSISSTLSGIAIIGIK